MPIRNYIENLSLSSEAAAQPRAFAMQPPAPSAEDNEPLPQSIPGDLKAAVDAGSLLSFVDGLSREETEDVLFSVQLAQRGASAQYDRFTEVQSWYRKYIEILENVGWVAEQIAFASFDQEEGEFRMDKAALAIIAAVATQNQLAVLNSAIKALEDLADENDAITLFDFHTSTEMSGNFQIGSVQRGTNGSLSLALGAFYFRSIDRRRRFLFFAWGNREVNLWTGAQKMTLNSTLYAPVRQLVRDKLGESAPDFIKEIKL